jgi:hypothetical protein
VRSRFVAHYEDIRDRGEASGGCSRDCVLSTRVFRDRDVTGVAAVAIRCAVPVGIAMAARRSESRS